MSTTDTRAAFEKRFGPNDSFAWRDENDNYKVASLQSAWEVWQAATEAAKATGTAQTKQLLEKIEQLEAEVLARKLNPLNPFYDLEKDKDFRDNFERLASQGISKKQRGMILREVMRAIHAYAAESVRKAEAARHPAPVAAQESAPAELPSFVTGQTYESSEYGPLVFERLDTYYGETTYQFFWPAERRKRWIRPDDLRRHFCAAPASPQPVAKVLTDEQIIAAFEPHIDSDPTAPHEMPTYWVRQDELIAYTRAILAAASTPTKLTEKKE